MQAPTDAANTQRPYADDEIDLFELFENLWKQKLLIVLITLVVTAGGVAYAYLATPVYQATSYLLPPSSKDTAELRKLNLVAQGTNTGNERQNPLSLSTEQYTPQDVYEQFLQTLQSNTARKALFEQTGVQQYFLAQTEGDELKAWKEFNKAINITLPKKDNPDSANISIKADSPETAADWTNKYVHIATQISRNQLTADLREEIQSHINQLELQIESRRSVYQSQIDTELSKLREALSVARAINLKEPLRTDSIIDDQKNTMMVDEIRRLYRLGSTALEAEIAAIEERRKNEAFIPGLTDLQQQKNLLEAMSVNPDTIKTVNIDLEALPDDTPIKPKKMLITALSVVLGGMAGVMIALVRTAIRNRRESQAS
jgi:chain length determinant protein (polysaccharide antigen chain regulator)